MSLLLLHLLTESTMVSHLTESFLSSCVGVKMLTPLLWKQLLGRICPQINITAELSDSNARDEIKLAQVLTWASDISEGLWEKLGKSLSC